MVEIKYWLVIDDLCYIWHVVDCEVPLGMYFFEIASGVDKHIV